MTTLRRWQVVALWVHGVLCGALVVAGWWTVLVALQALVFVLWATWYLAPLGPVS